MKIGAVPYINAWPLISYLEAPIQKATPAQLENLMERGDLDLALMPSFSFLNHPEWKNCAEAGIIGSFGAVGSVCVFYPSTYSDISQIKNIKYTIESKTSIALFKVIYYALTGKDPSTLKEKEEGAEARLLIGDEALFFKKPGTQCLDLGKCWTDLTGLPFVYALWVGRHENITGENLKLAKEKGLQNLEEIISQVQGFPQEVIRSYLTQKIHYEMLPLYQEGLKKFQDCCFELGLLKQRRKI